MPGRRAQALRERASGLGLCGLCLLAVGVGIAFSPEGNRYLALGMGLAGLAGICGFGIVWDMQYPPREGRERDVRIGIRHVLALVAILLFVLQGVTHLFW